MSDAVRKAALLLLTLSALFALGCGSDDSPGTRVTGVGAAPAKEVLRLFPSDRTYKSDDLVAAGMKVMNDYDVAALDHAVSAVHLALNNAEYEARFYASHQDAVNFGTAWAADVTGPNANVTGENVKWQEGASHRRMCSRAAGNPHSGCAYSARYGDYVIAGNMILLCEGAESEEAILTCNNVLKSLK